MPAVKPSLSARIKRAVDRAQNLVVHLTALLLVAWLIPPVRQWLDARNLGQALLVPVLGLAIVVTFRVMRELEEKVSAVVVQEGSILEGGVGAKLYQRVSEAWERSSKKRRFTDGPRRLDVLGLTLFTAWPNVRGVLEGSSELGGWHLRLFVLAPDHLEAHPDLFPKEWLSECEVRIGQIEDFQRTRAGWLAGRGITLELVRYRSFPAIHGFRIEGRELFVSVVQWRPDLDRLDGPYQFYEHFPASDKSLRAERYRLLFDNWLQRAEASAAFADAAGPS